MRKSVVPEVYKDDAERNAILELRKERRKKPQKNGIWYPEDYEGDYAYVIDQTVFQSEQHRLAYDRHTLMLRATGRDWRRTTYKVPVEIVSQYEIVVPQIQMDFAAKMAVKSVELDYPAAENILIIEDPVEVKHLGGATTNDLKRIVDNVPEDKRVITPLLSFALRSLSVIDLSSRVLVTGANMYERFRLIQLFVGRVRNLCFHDRSEKLQMVSVCGTNVSWGRHDPCSLYDVVMLGCEEPEENMEDMPDSQWEQVRASHILTISTPSEACYVAAYVNDWEVYSAAHDEEVAIGIVQPHVTTSLLGVCDACECVRRGIPSRSILSKQISDWWYDIHKDFNIDCGRETYCAIPSSFQIGGFVEYPVRKRRIMSWSVRPMHSTDWMEGLYYGERGIVEIEWTGDVGSNVLLGAQCYMIPHRWSIRGVCLSGAGALSLLEALLAL